MAKKQSSEGGGDKGADQTESSKGLLQSHSPQQEESEQPPLPETVTRTITEELFAVMRQSPSTNPIFEKITPEHLTLMLQHGSRETELAHERSKEREETRRRRLVAREQTARTRSVILGVSGGFLLLGVIALCWLFLDYGHPQYIMAVISAVFGFVGGFAGGLGYAKLNSNNRDRDWQP